MSCTVVMKLKEPKKHSVRFDVVPEDGDGSPRPPLSNVYLETGAWNDLGKPEQIIVSVAAADAPKKAAKSKKS